MKCFDKETHLVYEIYAYNAEKIADGTQEPKLVGSFDEKTMPSLETINNKLKEAGYDCFEIEKITTEVTRYVIK